MPKPKLYRSADKAITCYVCKVGRNRGLRFFEVWFKGALRWFCDAHHAERNKRSWEQDEFARADWEVADAARKAESERKANEAEVKAKPASSPAVSVPVVWQAEG